MNELTPQPSSQKLKQLNVIELAPSNNQIGRTYLLIESYYSTSYQDYYINGTLIKDILSDKQKLIITHEDKATYIPSSKQLSHYAKADGSTMSIEDYRSKPQYYSGDSDEKTVLRALANKKELEGFEPVYLEPQEELVEFKVVAYIEDTESEFINTCLKTTYSNVPKSLYTVLINEITLDEYDKLAKQYDGIHGKFEKRNRGTLELLKIDGKYTFTNHVLFKGASNEDFLDLDSAKKRECEIRSKVRELVFEKIFPKDEVTGSKKECIIDKLRFIRTLPLESMDGAIHALIKDLKDYRSISLNFNNNPS